ncbi:hypothetical protein K2Z84_21465 [Candidatus Binatia bacterium]|nr:hypothetical protein [Candidatus Binatia bacterium]
MTVDGKTVSAWRATYTGPAYPYGYDSTCRPVCIELSDGTTVFADAITRHRR